MDRGEVLRDPIVFDVFDQLLSTRYQVKKAMKSEKTMKKKNCCATSGSTTINTAEPSR